VPLILSDISNCHGGGDACDVTDLVCPGLIQIAEAAAKTVPELHVAGVDLIAGRLHASARIMIIEINTHPNFAIHHTCLRGTPRNPADAVVRAMVEASLSVSTAVDGSVGQ
jgi:D-alanine-D-alanine ligase-like ATP-grasp enzyme